MTAIIRATSEIVSWWIRD